MIPEEIMLLVLIFVLGTIAGSFINCLAWRIKQEETILGSSYCPKCRHKLGAFDLFPILSFLFLRGKCRYCKEKISFQYPLVEILTGFAFIFVYHYTGFGILTLDFQNVKFFELIFRWLLSILLLTAFVYDLKYFVIPDRITFSAIILTFLWIIAGFFLKYYTEMQVLNFLFSGLASAFFFFCLWFFSQGKAMGFGDVKLAFLLGLFLGYPVIIPALFVSFFLGALIGTILVLLRKKKMKSEVPFGPFLVMGTFIGMAWGKDILLWYLSFLK